MNYLKGKKLNLLVLLAAASQLITPLFATFDDSGTFNNPEIIPAGYAFGIWGVITTLGFVYGIYQFLPNRRNAMLHYRLGRILIVIYVLFSIWIYAADREWLIATLVIFILMFGLLTIAFREIINTNVELTLIERIVLECQVALYAGWTTVAIFANTAACLKYYGAFGLRTNVGDVIQFIVLVAALINSAYFIYRFRFNPFFIAAILWAFVGVYFGVQQKSGSVILQAASVVGIAVIISLAIISVWKRLRQSAQWRQE
jgi:hypothetical protein